MATGCGGLRLHPAVAEGCSPLARNRKFESISLQRRVSCEPDFLDRGAENIAERDSVTHYAQIAQETATVKSRKIK